MSKAKKPTVDDITRKKLLYAKQFYLHGEQHARQPQNAFDRMVAIHQFHAAAEIVLKAVYVKYAASEDITREKGKKGLKHLYFDELLKAIKPHCKWVTVPVEDFLLAKLNEKRHMAQHEAEPIAAEHLPEYQVETKSFLIECFLNEFEVNFDDLDLVDSVNDSKFRQVLVWAKELIELEKYEDSVAFSKLVYRIGFEYFQQRTAKLATLHHEIDHKLKNGIWETNTSERFRRAVSESFKDVIEEMKKMASQILVSGRTGGLQNYHRIGHIIPEIKLMQSGAVRYFSIGMGFVPQANESYDVREYVLNTILSWQEMGLSPKWVSEFSIFFDWAEKRMAEIRQETSA